MVASMAMRPCIAKVAQGSASEALCP